jgi:hypothetical protein
MDKYNFGNISLIKPSVTISVKSSDFENGGALSDDFIKGSTASLNGIKINFDDFIRDKVQKQINFYLKQKVTPSLKEGIYNHKLDIIEQFQEDKLILDNKKIREVGLLIEFEFEYKVEISNQLKQDYKIYKNRLIGFFDILGFSNILQTGNLEVLYANYAKLIDEANTQIFQLNNSNDSVNFEKAQFLFDSIVLVSKPVEDLKNISNFVDGCSNLFEKAFRQKLPLRGAITLGDFMDSTERNIFLSSAFSELVKEEKTQEWAGCIISKSCEKLILQAIHGSDNIEKSTNTKQDSLIFYYDVPLKNDSDKNYLSINYYYFLSNDEIKLGLEYLKGDKKKHQNMLKYTEYFQSLADTKTTFGESYIKTFKTRWGFRYKLVDKNGIEQIPKTNLKIPVEITDGKTIIRTEMIFKGQDDS